MIEQTGDASPDPSGDKRTPDKQRIMIHFFGSDGKEYHSECIIGPSPLYANEEEAVRGSIFFLRIILQADEDRKFWWFQRKKIPTFTLDHIEYL